MSKKALLIIALVWQSLLSPTLVNAAVEKTPANITPTKTAVSLPKTATNRIQTLPATPVAQFKTTAALFPADIQQILSRGYLLVAMPKKDNSPFYAVNEKGQYWGLDIELARGFAKQMGVGIIFNRDADSFDAAVDDVVHHRSDVAICKLSRTFKRAMQVRYSQPYVVLRQALLLNRLVFANQSKNSPSVEEAVQKLHGKIGIIANSSYIEFAARYFPDTKVVTYETWEQVVQAAAKGEVVAAYRDELEVKKVVKAQPETALKFKTAVINDATDTLAIAVASDSTTLLALINVYLEEQHLSLTADKILDKYAEQLFKKKP